ANQAPSDRTRHVHNFLARGLDLGCWYHACATNPYQDRPNPGCARPARHPQTPLRVPPPLRARLQHHHHRAPPHRRRNQHPPAQPLPEQPAQSPLHRHMHQLRPRPRPHRPHRLDAPAPPRPAPDFQRVAARLPEPNWQVARLGGDILNITNRFLVLNPREGFAVNGICDAWNGLVGDDDDDDDDDDDETLDETYLTLMTDIIPSMADTLRRNGTIYDAHAFHAKAAGMNAERPGVPAEIKNSLAEGMKADTYSQTVTLDVEFKRRVGSGMRWVFERTATKMLEKGRMDVEITICDEGMGLVCWAQQTVLAMDAGRKFRGGGGEGKGKEGIKAAL
ncbi:hypothetical protein B0T17DRAFT_624858, partial [Bombardia bombarda]